MPSFVCIANTVAKLQARQLGRNRHIVARSAKLLSPNAKVVSRLNSLILADRRLKNAFHIRKPGAKSRNLRSEFKPEVVLAAILAKNRKSTFSSVQYFRCHWPCKVDIGGRHLVFVP